MSEFDIFNRIESEVRDYCRRFPMLLTTAQGCHLFDINGRRYLDFLTGAGALNYGHNDPVILEAVLSYLGRGGVLQSLDLHTEAKAAFLDAFERIILRPRQLNYRIQFTGPTGSSAVEAALKLARKITGRSTVAAFTHAYHGISLGALSVSANATKRSAAGVALTDVVRLPYDGLLNSSVMALQAMLADGSGNDLPAAVIVETVQAEGGVNVASLQWLRELAELSRKLGMLLIVDEVQTGCGRTGSFFSFEDAGIVPDIVCLSKSIGGIGIPMALVLIRAEHDQWAPGEHNGTFRGNNLAFIAARAALERYWQDSELENAVRRKGEFIATRLERIASHLPVPAQTRGRGMLRGLACQIRPEFAEAMSLGAFRQAMIIETCGVRDHVLKLLPPLTIDDASLAEGLDILEAVANALMVTA
jgi:diaminobutyrate-2-oxoglutarate transaminase